MTKNPFEVVRQHERYRSQCINLIASENILSPRVKQALASDMASRYAFRPEFYAGTSKVHQIWEMAEHLGKEVFGADFCSVAPLSGHLALMMTLYAIAKRGAKIASVDPKFAGYPGLEKDKIPEIFGYQVLILPEREINVDREKAVEMINAEKPEVVVLGASLILYPIPVREISEAVHSYGGYVVYDGSHVLGLIAGGLFQQPLKEGADVLLGSTHKSLFGPQGGMILTNDERIFEAINTNTLHKFVDNIHFNRVAALAIALDEIKRHGRRYAEKVVENANQLAVSLDRRDVKPFKSSLGYTRSHQIYLPYVEQEAAKIRDTLEKNNIIADMGVRLGTNEVTRRGMGLKEMTILADYISRAIEGENVRKVVVSLAKRFNSVKFV
ncbi:MAG: hypothetical protein RMI49_00400 [Candidatus Caldarchaeum sp.]|nr:hypothetical protein [Candidatus Caldarchaeum sp.]